MTFREFCYELYKNDWERRISPERKAQSLKDYYKDKLEGMEEDFDFWHALTYEEYLLERGYQGEIYTCFAEFLQTEYQDISYMKNLLGDNGLIRIYLSDFVYAKEETKNIEEIENEEEGEYDPYSF